MSPMAQSVILSENGQLMTPDGRTIEGMKLLGGRAKATITQTFATADPTHAARTAVALVHSAVGGTANGTLVDCTASYSEAAVEENFKELATTMNLVIADQVDTASLLNSVIDELQAAGILG